MRRRGQELAWTVAIYTAVWFVAAIAVGLVAAGPSAMLDPSLWVSALAFSAPGAFVAVVFVMVVPPARGHSWIWIGVVSGGISAITAAILLPARLDFAPDPEALVDVRGLMVVAAMLLWGAVGFVAGAVGSMKRAVLAGIATR